MNTTILHGKRVLITAGPTREAIDPVRYISNHSSGKMGYAIAEQFLNLGAIVTLISGPVNLTLDHPCLNIVSITTAGEMYLACCQHFEEADIVVFSAAVADYRPAKVARQKIKKDDESFSFQMVKNIDIAFEFGKVKQNDQLSIGFALETCDEYTHAIKKMEKKNFDLVILNSMNDDQAGFGFDTNRITTISRDHSKKVFPLKSKKAVARDIVSETVSLLISRYEMNEIASFD
ncbi:phosphopantothenoylcysteine decarboxylase/phosphopantothenate--cysteine ligase domain protein [Ostertagia ostertagi]